MPRHLLFLAVLAVACGGGGSSGPAPSPDTFQVTDVVPASGTDNVPSFTGINVVFSGPVEESELSAAFASLEDAVYRAKGTVPLQAGPVTFELAAAGSSIAAAASEAHEAVAVIAARGATAAVKDALGAVNNVRVLA